MIKDLCFEIIQTCPNDCLFCSSLSNIDCKQIISFDLFKKTIDYLMSKGKIEEISLSGGEPLLHPQVFEMIEYCKSLGIRVVLFTSGIKYNEMKQEDIDEYLKQVDLYWKECKVSEEKRKQILTKYKNIFDSYQKQFEPIKREDMKRLKEIGLDKIVFDLQGASEETIKLLMGRNHFTIIAQSIIRASLEGLETDVHFIPMKSNYKELPDLIELLNIAEVNNLSILNFVPQGRGKLNEDKIRLSIGEMAEFVEIFKRCKDLFNGNIRVGIPLIKDDKHLCTAGLDKMVIKYDGTVLPCPAFKEYDIEKLNRLGIKTPNIKDDLESIEIHNGRRREPLCKRLYNFNSSLM